MQAFRSVSFGILQTTITDELLYLSLQDSFIISRLSLHVPERNNER